MQTIPQTDTDRIAALQVQARDLLAAVRETMGQLDGWETQDQVDSFAEILDSSIADYLDVAAKIAREEAEQADPLSPSHDRLSVHQLCRVG